MATKQELVTAETLMDIEIGEAVASGLVDLGIASMARWPYATCTENQ